MGSDSGVQGLGNALDDLASPALDPLFRPQARTGVPSAWHGHVPFAQWLVSATRPGLIVELGTHNGVSYSAFCETVLRDQIPARCYAVDSWAGDEHAGHYGETVYAELRAFHDGRYGAFSELLRMTFDEARGVIPDGAVDLLHIDGFHSYEAVRHDFETWMPKLSPRAVVLFHDTNVLERGFGVARFWAEIRERYPSFEFLHGHGLGVLAVGPEAPAAVLNLCNHASPAAIGVLRDRFAVLARAHVLEFALREALRQQEQKLQGEVDALRQSLDAALQARAAAESHAATLQSSLSDAQDNVRQLEAAGLESQLRHAACEARLEMFGAFAVEQPRLVAEAEALRGHLAAARADVKVARELAAQAQAEPVQRDGAMAALPAAGAWSWAAPLNGLRRRPIRH